MDQVELLVAFLCKQLLIIIKNNLKGSEVYIMQIHHQLSNQQLTRSFFEKRWFWIQEKPKINYILRRDIDLQIE